MSYTPVCFCPRSSVEVTVVDGVIVDVVTDEAGAFGTGAEGLTVDDLFTLIAAAALAPPALRERGRRVPPIPGGRRRRRRGE